MSPIPANASAAMIFSFFVAVIVTPYLMLKVSGKAPVVHHDEAHGGKLGQIYASVARPILKTKTRSWIFLLAVGVLTLGSLSLFYTKHVTVKLLPFDNKSELSVMIDLPEGSSVEATDRVAQDIARIVVGLPEVVSVQTHAGTAAPFNFNGLVRHSYMRSQPYMGDVAVNLTGKGERDRSSHQIALDIRNASPSSPCPSARASRSSSRRRDRRSWRRCSPRSTGRTPTRAARSRPVSRRPSAAFPILSISTTRMGRRRSGCV